jgi:FKBP-type peptidyl-prolyl cis-trans isomerase FklB
MNQCDNAGMTKPVHLTLFTAVIALLAGTAVTQAGKSQKTPVKAAPRTAASPSPSPTDSTLKTQKDKVSYAIGMQVANSISRQSLDIDPDVLLKGLKDEMAGKSLMTDAEAHTTMTQVFAELRAKQEEKMKQAGEVNKKTGEDFLAANKSKPGVVTTASGLQYKVITQGTGPKPTASDTVICNYKGTLIDGKEFDSSYKRGQPATFPVSGVIKGWTEALQLMPVGSKYELYIPSDLAYGERGAGADIGPNTTLIFQVELLSIQGKDVAK